MVQSRDMRRNKLMIPVNNKLKSKFCLLEYTSPTQNLQLSREIFKRLDQMVSSTKDAAMLYIYPTYGYRMHSDFQRQRKKKKSQQR